MKALPLPAVDRYTSVTDGYLELILEMFFFGKAIRKTCKGPTWEIPLEKLILKTTVKSFRKNSCF